jgi:hypothetical protein
MSEVLLTKETCVPGTRVKPSHHLNQPAFERYIKKIGGPNAEGTVIHMPDKNNYAHVVWDNKPDAEEYHNLEFYDLALITVPISWNNIQSALDTLEQKLSK